MRNKNHQHRKPQTDRVPAGKRLVIGKNSVTELLRWNRDKISRLYYSRKTSVSHIDLPHHILEEVDFDYLTDLSNSEHHQGIAAIINDNSAEINFKQHLKNLESKADARILMLSTVQDPHHLGAAFRAAEVFGVDLLVFGSTNSTGITPAVSKVAVGGAELVTYCQVANVNEAIRKAKDSQFWVIAAEPPQPGSGIEGQSLEKFEFPERSMIVFGAEGEGLPKLTKELSDFQVHIAQKGKIDSLSLSQAISIFLYAATKSSKN